MWRRKLFNWLLEIKFIFCIVIKTSKGVFFRDYDYLWASSFFHYKKGQYQPLRPRFLGIYDSTQMSGCDLKHFCSRNGIDVLVQHFAGRSSFSLLSVALVGMLLHNNLQFSHSWTVPRWTPPMDLAKIFGEFSLKKIYLKTMTFNTLWVKLLTFGNSHYFVAGRAQWRVFARRNVSFIDYVQHILQLYQS